jgi:hypothetical protein
MTLLVNSKTPWIITWHPTVEAQRARGGFVANFAQEVVKEQLPLSAGGLGGQGVEQFGRSEALVSLLHHQLSFPDHVQCSSL